MWIALIAMAFYALEIAITDFKLSAISPRLLTLMYSVGVATFAFISLIFNPARVGAPHANQMSFIASMIIVSFIAASAHFYAINQGIGTTRLTLVYALLPVAGSLYILILKRELPSWNLIIAYILAAIALYLVSKTYNPIEIVK